MDNNQNMMLKEKIRNAYLLFYERIDKFEDKEDDK